MRSMDLATGAARHRFLAYSNVTPSRRVVREIAIELMNLYGGVTLSRGRWLKVPRTTFGWWRDESDGTPTGKRRVNETSHAFDLTDVERALDARGTFDWKAFNIFEPACNWLDPTVTVATNFHAFDGTSAFTMNTPTSFGPMFPIIPALDREGLAFSSLQRVVLGRVAELRRAVVDGSHTISDDSFRWFQDLRARRRVRVAAGHHAAPTLLQGAVRPVARLDF